jgi:tungstate transport system substrate-binding protein
MLVHARAAEEESVAAGHATHRREIMYNDFVVVGPSGDPAAVAAASGAADAFGRIADTTAPFVSRGDDSGTYRAELSIWALAGRDTATFGPWYKAVGAGMGAALNTAAGLDAYILSDRATWLTFGNPGDLVLLYAGDPALFNQYAYLPVNPATHPTVRNDLAIQLEGWLTGQRARDLINGYTVNGQALFVFNATPN